MEPSGVPELQPAVTESWGRLRPACPVAAVDLADVAGPAGEFARLTLQLRALKTKGSK